MTEKRLEDAIRHVARQLNWLEYHPYDSRKSTPGFPDLTLVRGGILIFAENKSATGKASVPQVGWLEELSEIDPDGGRVLVCLWRPEDWDTSRIMDILANARRPIQQYDSPWWQAYLETSWFHNRRKPYFPEEG